MRSKKIGIAATAILLLIAAAGLSVGRLRRAAALDTPSSLSTRALAAARMPYDPALLEGKIACFSGRIQRDPNCAIDCAILSAAYLQRCRETGDIADAQRAEAAARRSLQIRRRHNDAAYNALILSLFTQHRFPEALSLALEMARVRPDDPQALSALIEIETESGRYVAASRDMARLSRSPDPGPYSLALRARLLEIEGQLLAAQRQLEQAASMVDHNYDSPRENVAWFHFRVGTLRAQLGDAVGAEQAYGDALAWYPQDYKTMLGLAKLAAGQGRWAEAIAWGEKSAAIVPTPEVAGLLVDCYQAAGNADQASVYRGVLEAMRRLSKSQGAIYDRQRALYCADHDIHLDEALTLARRELTARQDIYAYDTLGWTCYRCGRLSEADAAMKRALATGSQDAVLYYHAGMIAAARHHDAEAARDLTRALTLNPYFQPFGPRLARATLARLGRRTTGEIS